MFRTANQVQQDVNLSEKVKSHQSWIMRMYYGFTNIINSIEYITQLSLKLFRATLICKPAYSLYIKLNVKFRPKFSPQLWYIYSTHKCIIDKNKCKDLSGLRRSRLDWWSCIFLIPLTNSGWYLFFSSTAELFRNPAELSATNKK